MKGPLCKSCHKEHWPRERCKFDDAPIIQPDTSAKDAEIADLRSRLVTKDAEIARLLAANKALTTEIRSRLGLDGIDDGVVDLNKPGYLYRHFDKDGALLYVGVSINAVARLGQHKQGSQWFGEISHIEIEKWPTMRAALREELAAIAIECPVHNVRRPTISTPAIPKTTKNKANRNEYQREFMRSKRAKEKAAKAKAAAP